VRGTTGFEVKGNMQNEKPKYGPTKEHCPICGLIMQREYGGPGIDWLVCPVPSRDHVSYMAWRG